MYLHMNHVEATERFAGRERETPISQVTPSQEKAILSIILNKISTFTSFHHNLYFCKPCQHNMAFLTQRQEPLSQVTLYYS